MPPKSNHVVELEKRVDQHDHRIETIEEAADATRENVATLRDKHDSIKDEHGGEIKALRVDVNTLKDEVRFWRGVVVGLGSAIILALVGLLLKK